MADSGVSPLSYAASASSLAPVANSAISAACCRAWPTAAAWPLSGSRSAMRILPDEVTGEPIEALTVVGGAAGVLGLGCSPHAPSNKAVVASAKRDWRIGAKLRRTAAHGRQRRVTS